jgi:hypothetical protein
MPEAPYFDASPETLKQIAQSLLEVKKMARSIENAAETLIVLTDNGSVRASLGIISAATAQMLPEINKLYGYIAREASKA